MSLDDIRAIYAGAGRILWELLMGQQIHVGGMASSAELASKAGIAAGSCGVDLCCCTGSGMRYLVRHRQVARMVGVDATDEVLRLGRKRTCDEGLGDRLDFVLAEATATGLPGGQLDFAWGEDAWCYVDDKQALVAEAARLVRPGGTIAFTDWLEGPARLTPAEADRFFGFMKFPGLADLDGYRRLLEMAGWRVERAEDTGRFARFTAMYAELIHSQFAADTQAILGFDRGAYEAVLGEVRFIAELAAAGKAIQGLFVGRKER